MRLTEQDIISGILDREGAQYTDRAADRGGPTKYGITIATLRRWRGRRVSHGDVRELSEEEARHIYQDRYVTPWRWVEDERLRLQLIDWAVTSWHDDPARALQRAVGATADGIIGPETKRKTSEAITAGRAADVNREVLRARVEYYLHLALDELAFRMLLKTAGPLQVENLRGWIRRALLFA